MSVGGKMSFSQSISIGMGKYATFSGRASRSEFWWFYLFLTLLSWVVPIVGAVIIGGNPLLQEILTYIVALAVFLPMLSVTARRLHDTGRTGWWQLLYLTIIGGILVLIWCAFDTKMETNKYGPIPEDKMPSGSDDLTTTG